MENNLTLNNTSKSYLNIISLMQTESWSVQSLLDNNVNYNKKYPLARLGNFLTRSRESIIIDDSTQYKRVTVKINNGGVFLRDIELGSNIGTKKQYIVRSGQFVLSKIDARNGAFGIIPDELDGAIVTNDFPLFDVDKNIILPQFLVLITTTKQFIKFAQSCSSGTTNRQRMDIDLFLNQKIPLPSILEQENILGLFNSKIEKALNFENEANVLESEIEKRFLQELGLKSFSIKEVQKGLHTTDYSVLDRWDFFSNDARILIELSKSKYELTPLGKAFSFAKRSWNKTKHSKETFKYIEIGAIDPIKGITEAKNIFTSKAPSRATQIIKYGDLILGTTRPYLKKFVIVPEEYNDCVCSSGFSVIEPSENYHLPFLLQFLRCSYGIEQLKNRMTGGLYPAITETELKNIKIPLPKIKEQIKIMDLIIQMKNNIIVNIQKSNRIRLEAENEFEREIFGK